MESPVTQAEPSDLSKRLYRIDRFIVPRAAREELLEKVRLTHELLRKQAGFIQDFVLEQMGGTAGELTLLTFVEWESAAAVEKARAAVMALHAQMRFDKDELFARLGIRPELAMYRPL
jgi:heme-degrading monooxygenase HmoA